jgi:hypothetical protein
VSGQKDKSSTKPDETDGDDKGKDKAKTGGTLEELLEDLDETARKAVLGEVRKARTEAARYRAERDELKPHADKAKAEDDASKGDVEKAAERATKAEAALAEKTLEVLRLQVALDKGLTAHQAKRLVGSTKEELEDDADELVESFGVGKSGDDDGKDSKSDDASKTPLTRKPKEKLRAGSDPEDEPEESDPAKLAALISAEG